MSIVRTGVNPSLVERQVERAEEAKEARGLVAHMPKGARRHNYIDRLARDVRRQRLDPEVFRRFMRIIGG